MKRCLFLIIFLLLMSENCYCNEDIYARSYDRQQWRELNENALKESVTHQSFDGLDYIKIIEFRKNTYDEFYNILDNIRSDRVIIDLRDNKGGYIAQAARSAGLLLPENTQVLKVTYNNGGEAVYYAEGRFSHVKAVILVNVITASAAEAFALALGQNGAVAVGEATYGKTSVQRLTASPTGGEKYTVGTYTVGGKDISSGGIMPDYRVNNDITIEYDKVSQTYIRREKDNQLIKAIEVLEGLDYEYLS